MKKEDRKLFVGAVVVICLIMMGIGLYRLGRDNASSDLGQMTCEEKCRYFAKEKGMDYWDCRKVCSPCGKVFLRPTILTRAIEKECFKSSINNEDLNKPGGN